AVGFLFNEAVINTRGEIASLTICKQNTLVDLWLNRSVEKPSIWQRTSGCTGGVTAATRGIPSSLTDAPAEVSPLTVITGMDQMLQAQAMYREAGGLHCSALSDGETIRYMAEDIGRHNTLDKLAGLMQMDDARFIPRIIFTTGRVSSDMLQKSARMGAFLVASRTTPTSLSIKFAQKLGITLVGYVRRDHFTVYAHPERFTGVDSPIVSDAAE
ncbi:MAG: formate dehydrogenase accessory sulfurtransferase FdhD, partial [Anaerolineaceae bacterium]|nr:formate dehydrogenase accessory sulfurtransferase FdhD [Anaerolineaceae bacterium]